MRRFTSKRKHQRFTKERGDERNHGAGASMWPTSRHFTSLHFKQKNSEGCVISSCCRVDCRESPSAAAASHNVKRIRQPRRLFISFTHAVTLAHVSSVWSRRNTGGRAARGAGRGLSGGGVQVVAHGQFDVGETKENERREEKRRGGSQPRDVPT